MYPTLYFVIVGDENIMLNYFFYITTHIEQFFCMHGDDYTYTYVTQLTAAMYV